MSGRGRKIVKRLLISAGMLVGLIILTLVCVSVASWYLARDDYAYTWDHSVENASGRAGNRYPKDHRHRGVAAKGLGAPDFAQAVRDNIEWVSVMPFGWQRELSTPEILMSDDVESWAPTDAQLRRAIEAAHAVYNGDLIYAANWDGEYEGVAFWDALDAIGVQAYFPLTEENVPSVTKLTRAWAPHVNGSSTWPKSLAGR